MLSSFQYFIAAFAHLELERGKSKASHRTLRCIDLGNIVHTAAPRRVTCYSSREIRTVWSSGVCQLPLLSEVFGNAVSGDAAMSFSSSCCAPINLLRCSPKPQYGHSYMCIHILAACVVGTFDTCPVTLDIRLPHPSTSVLSWTLPDVRSTLDH